MSTKLKLELQIHFCPFDERCHGDEFVVRKMELSTDWASSPVFSCFKQVSVLLAEFVVIYGTGVPFAGGTHDK